jgi:HlyD family secretion protein
MPRWLPWSIGAAVAGGLLLWATVLTPELVPVRVVTLSQGRVESTVTNTKAGAIRARRRAQLSPQVGGRVLEIAHREGDWAKERLGAAQAAQREACIQRDRARRELERKRELAAENIVSDDLLDQLESASLAATASCNRARAEVGTAQARIAATEVELAKMVMRAPFRGVIAEVTVEIGEWITPSPPLLTAPAVIDVIDPTSVYVSAPMDEVDSASIRAGQPAKVTVDSHPGREFVGSVSRVAPYVLDIEAQNRTVEIEVELRDVETAATLLPGTSADVEVVLEARDPVLRLPTSALLEGDRVLVADNGRLEERSVEIGLKNWDYAEVTAGLEPGQRVVVSLDRVEVKAGARVEVEEIEYRP